MTSRHCSQFKYLLMNSPMPQHLDEQQCWNGCHWILWGWGRVSLGQGSVCSFTLSKAPVTKMGLCLLFSQCRTKEAYISLSGQGEGIRLLFSVFFPGPVLPPAHLLLPSSDPSLFSLCPDKPYLHPALLQQFLQVLRPSTSALPVVKCLMTLLWLPAPVVQVWYKCTASTEAW